VTRVIDHALLVPERAVGELQGQYQVRVMGADNRVKVKPVAVGARVDGMWIVSDGLRAGERVAADGAQFMRDGTIVTPVPFKAATED
jgi:membrane fusion protein, multidrug efflux system